MFASPQIWIPQPKKIVAAAAPSWHPTANPAWQAIGFGSSTATFSSQAVNNPSTSDVIVVFIASDQNGPDTGATIGGDTMTLGTRSGSDNTYCAIYYITGHTYTTPNIVITQGSTFDNVCIAVGYLTGVNSTPGTAQVRSEGFSTDPHTTSAITVPSTGFGLVCGIFGTTGGVTANGVNVKDYETVGSSKTLIAGNIATAGSQTPSYNAGNINSGMCAIPWGP